MSPGFSWVPSEAAPDVLVLAERPCTPASLLPDRDRRLTAPPWLSVASLWDDCAHTARRQRHGVALRLTRAPIRICVSRLGRAGWIDLLSREYQPDGQRGKRNSLAYRVFDDCRRRLKQPLLLVGAQYCQAEDLLLKVRARSTAIAASVPPRLVQDFMAMDDWSFLSSVTWHDSRGLAGAFLTPIVVGDLVGQLFAFDAEPILLPRRGTKFFAYFGKPASWSAIAQVAHITRMPRAPAKRPEPVTRYPRRREPMASQRPNVAVAVRQDTRRAVSDVHGSSVAERSKNPIVFADLFAGAGGLSLGFLTARNARYRLCSAVDISPICITTLRNNFVGLERRIEVTGEVDDGALLVADASRCAKAEHFVPQASSNLHVDVLVGGPPCQPFSSARRRPATPSEARLIDSFCRAVELVQPTTFVLENVQGILWQGHSRVSPAQKLMRRLQRAGYRVAARVLDAVWFGVPQHRARAFVIGTHVRLASGITPEDAFPTPRYTGTPATPYRTVRDAIGHLPDVPNGHSILELPASAIADERNPLGCDRVLDHVTSRHADYVIARFRRLKPGENWVAIQDMMTNYSRREATHSNIYRRLEWDKPSVTLGHYRKSMLVHPSQDRGLSLREALRLQSFPDWYRLWGHEETLTIGLDRKQQQLANAVPPALARAVAEQLAELVRKEA